MGLLKKYLSIISFITTGILLFKVFFLNTYPDFTVYYYSSQTFFSGGNPYLGGEKFFTSFVYPPFVLLFFLPLSFLPVLLAEKLWTFLGVLFLMLSLFFLFKIFKQSFFSSTFFILCSFIFFSFPVKFTLGMGQINLLVLFLLVLFYYFLIKKKNYYSGFFLGLSITLKLFPVFLLPYLLIKKKWKILFAALAMIIISLVVTFLFIQSEINIYFFQKVLPKALESWKGDYYNQALSGFLMRSFKDEFLREKIRIIISAILAFLSFLVIMKKNTRNIKNGLEIGLLIILSLLINGFSWQHHFVWLIVPFFVIFFHLNNKKLGLGYYLFLGFSYLLVAFNFKNPSSFPVVFQSHVFFGGLSLWFLNLYLLFKDN